MEFKTDDLVYVLQHDKPRYKGKVFKSWWKSGHEWAEVQVEYEDMAGIKHTTTIPRIRSDKLLIREEQAV